MINIHPHVKVVLSLRERKAIVEKSYRLGGTVGFWIPIWIFGFEVFYYVCKLLAMDLFMVAEMAGDTNLIESKLDLIFDIVLLAVPGAFTILSYLAFGLRKRLANIILLVADIGFVIIAVTAIVLNFSRSFYIVGLLYSVALVAVCIDCLKAYNDEQLLKKADGYPHFNPTLMQDEEPKVSKLRFREKKSFDELYEERMEEYAEINPDSFTGKAYKKRKEEKREEEIDDWLGNMFTKNEKNE